MCFVLIKMTVAGQIKILDPKNKQDEAQYDLDGKAAKISALWSNNLGKHEYWTDEDLNYSQILLNKQDLSILYWVKFLIMD